MKVFAVPLLVGVVLSECTPLMLKIDKNLVLSSVYDAIRENGDKTIKIDPNDGRNKRNINYYGYEDYKNDDYGEVLHSPPIKQQCKPEAPAVQSISISDHNWSSVGSSLVQFLKFLMTVLALIALPVILLQAFILPVKILMGLKSMAFANTLLLGTFLLKYMNRSNRGGNGDDTDDNDNGSNGTSNEVENRFYYPFKTEDLDNLDESEIKTILKFIKMKNKKW